MNRLRNLVPGELRPGHLRCIDCGSDVERDHAVPQDQDNDQYHVHYTCTGDCGTTALVQRVKGELPDVEHELLNLQQKPNTHLNYGQQQQKRVFQPASEMRSDGGTQAEQPVEDSEPEDEPEAYNEYVSDRTEDLEPDDRVVVSTYRDDHLNLIPADVLDASHRVIKLDVPTGAPLDKWVFREEDSEYLLAIVGPDVQAVDVYRPVTEEVGESE
jgi:hypothetical protein